ncbi:MAG TPA: hypothetical protein HPP56_02925 [Nitrospirae bacterium]|nr:hypothetical protein [Nitrospirota bacterium]
MQCLMAKPYKLFFIRCRIKILHQPFLADFIKLFSSIADFGSFKGLF